MKKAKILLCHDYYQQAGGESSVFETEVKGLQSLGHPVSIYSRDNSEINAMNPLRKISIVPAAFYSRQTNREIAQLVRQEKPDIAIVQNVFPLMSPSIYGTLQAFGVPVIQAVYNYRLICPAAELYSHGSICERCLKGNYLHCVARRCYRNSIPQSAWYASIIGGHRLAGTFVKSVDLFMVPDHFLGSKLVEGGLPISKIRRNVNPFFVHDYTPAGTHHGYILYVGRLIPQKGIFTLLKAMRLIQSHAQLVIVGQGELLDRIQSMIARPEMAGKVSLIEPQWGGDLARLVAQAAAIVIPSEWYDNLPLVLCQANAMGKPVIASRINGIPEYVREGENGFLFEPGQAEELAFLIDRVISMSDSAYRQISVWARSFAEETFDFKAHYEVLKQMMEEVLSSM